MTPDPLLRGDAAARVVNLIRAYAASGGRVFVDSGAFVEERLLDFEVDVFPVYERGAALEVHSVWITRLHPTHTTADPVLGGWCSAQTKAVARPSGG